MLTKHFKPMPRCCATSGASGWRFLRNHSRIAAIVMGCAVSLGIGPVSAQSARDYGLPQMTHDAGSLRSFHGPTVQIRRSFRSDSEANSVLRSVLEAAGLAGMEDRIHLRASAETKNAVATIEGNQRVVFYNADFMQRVREQTGEYWSLVAILAHEIGHHVRFHTIIPGRDHEFELEADYQAGFILRRMGATREQALAAFRQFPEAETPSHPGRAQRIQQVTLGWIKGGDGGTPPVSGAAASPATTPSAVAPNTKTFGVVPAPRAPAPTSREPGLTAAQKSEVVKLLDLAIQHVAYHPVLRIAVRNITGNIPTQYRSAGVLHSPEASRRGSTTLALGERGAVLAAYQKITGETLSDTTDKNRLIAALEAAKANFR